MISQLCMIGIGGFLGAIARYWVNIHFSRSGLFPAGTFLVNITGSFFMGVLIGNEWIFRSISPFLSTGFLGAYTTFSTFNYELYLLKKNNRNFIFNLYLCCSYFLGIFSAFVGYWTAVTIL